MTFPAFSGSCGIAPAKAGRRRSCDARSCQARAPVPARHPGTPGQQQVLRHGCARRCRAVPRCAGWYLPLFRPASACQLRYRKVRHGPLQFRQVRCVSVIPGCFSIAKIALAARRKWRYSQGHAQRAARGTKAPGRAVRKRAEGDEPAAGHPGRPAPPCQVQAPPAAHPHQARLAQDGRFSSGDESALDACIARLLDAAPPLTSQQRDILALLLRRPPPQVTAPAGPSAVPPGAVPVRY